MAKSHLSQFEGDDGNQYFQTKFKKNDNVIAKDRKLAGPISVENSAISGQVNP